MKLLNPSISLLRTNPLLSTNVKITVDDNGNLALNSFKSNPFLESKRFKKFIVGKGSYEYDLYNFWRSSEMDKNLVFNPTEEIDSTFQKTNYNYQYENLYIHGCERLVSKLYDEEFSYLAPLWIGKQIPDFFIIFKSKENLNAETAINPNKESINWLKNNIQNDKIVKVVDLRSGTKIGDYIRNYVNNPAFKTDSMYFSFSNENSYIWGIDLLHGGFVEKKINIDSFFLDDYTQMEWDNNLTNLYKNNWVANPFILNLEFLFNDTEKWELNKYYGFYVSAQEISKFSKTNFNNICLNETAEIVTEPTYYNDEEVKNKSIPFIYSDDISIFEIGKIENQIKCQSIKLKNIINFKNSTFAFNIPTLQLNSNNKRYIEIEIVSQPNDGEFFYIEWKGANSTPEDPIYKFRAYFCAQKWKNPTLNLISNKIVDNAILPIDPELWPIGSYSTYTFSSNGSTQNIAKSLADCINSNSEFISPFIAQSIGNKVYIVTRLEDNPDYKYLRVGVIKETLYNDHDIIIGSAFPIKPNILIKNLNNLKDVILLTDNAPINPDWHAYTDVYLDNDISRRKIEMLIYDFNGIGFTPIDVITTQNKNIIESNSALLKTQSGLTKNYFIEPVFGDYVNDKWSALGELWKLTTFNIDDSVDLKNKNYQFFYKNYISFGVLNFYPLAHFDTDTFSKRFSKSFIELEFLQFCKYLNIYISNPTDDNLKKLDPNFLDLLDLIKSDLIKSQNVSTEDLLNLSYAKLHSTNNPILNQLKNLFNTIPLIKNYTDLTLIENEYQSLNENYLKETAFINKTYPKILKWVSNSTNCNNEPIRNNLNTSFGVYNALPDFNSSEVNMFNNTNEFPYLDSVPSYIDVKNDNLDAVIRSGFFNDSFNNIKISDFSEKDIFTSFFTIENFNNLSIETQRRYSEFKTLSGKSITNFKGLTISVEELIKESTNSQSENAKKWQNLDLTDFKFSFKITPVYENLIINTSDNTLKPLKQTSIRPITYNLIINDKFNWVLGDIRIKLFKIYSADDIDFNGDIKTDSVPLYTYELSKNLIYNYDSVYVKINNDKVFADISINSKIYLNKTLKQTNSNGTWYNKTTNEFIINTIDLESSYLSELTKKPNGTYNDIIVGNWTIRGDLIKSVPSNNRIIVAAGGIINNLTNAIVNANTLPQLGSAYFKSQNVVIKSAGNGYFKKIKEFLTTSKIIENYKNGNFNLLDSNLKKSNKKVRLVFNLPERVLKPEYLTSSVDVDIPPVYVSTPVIGYVLTEGVGKIVPMFRNSDFYNPLFKNVLKFLNPATQNESFLNRNLEPSYQNIYIEGEWLNLTNHIRTHLLNIPPQNSYLPQYPLIGEHSIIKYDINPFVSYLGVNSPLVYSETTRSHIPASGTFSTSERKYYLGTNLISLDDIILTDFEVSRVNNKFELRIDLKNKFKEFLKNKIKHNFFEMQKMQNGSNIIPPFTLTDKWLDAYIIENWWNLYTIDFLDFFVLESNIIRNLPLLNFDSDSNLIRLGYKKINNISITNTNDIYVIKYALKNATSSEISFSPKLKLKIN